MHEVVIIVLKYSTAELKQCARGLEAEASEASRKRLHQLQHSGHPPSRRATKVANPRHLHIPAVAQQGGAARGNIMIFGNTHLSGVKFGAFELFCKRGERFDSLS